MIRGAGLQLPDALVRVADAPGVPAYRFADLPARPSLAPPLQSGQRMCSQACSRTVLVVDDDQEIREVMEDLLLEIGVEVVTAQDGLEALKLLERGLTPCLTLLDLMMPRMNGEEFARAVGAQGRALTLVSMSAGERCLGPPLVRDHIRKPFRLEQIESLVTSYCAGGAAGG